jgi:hypothetical protein
MRRRTTTDLLILMISSTLCLAILIALISVGMVALVHPEIDTSQAANAISGVLSTLVGLLAGFLAGRTQRQQRAMTKAQDDTVEQERVE